MPLTQTYYTLKPLIPRRIQIAFRRRLAAYKRGKYAHVWPIDPNAAIPPKGWRGWPGGKKFAVVLSHDVDTLRGYENVLNLVALEEEKGFRSQFNFVPERYGRISPDLLDELRRRGFGIGVHGLKHDGKLFSSKQEFDRRAIRINEYLMEWKTQGFTSPSMHHNLEWMTGLNIAHSTSTFDTDPFEPQPDSAGTIFPFPVCNHAEGASGSSSTEPCSLNPGSPNAPQNPLKSGRCFLELPYTLPQDSTLYIILQEKSTDVWKRKLDWIADKGGMVLLNTHPDYMAFDGEATGLETYPAEYYTDFLGYLRSNHADRFWQALPMDVADFWVRRRTSCAGEPE